MVQITIEIDASTKTRLVKRAKQLGVSVSELIRSIILKGVRK